jgi:hypothetical protein
VLLEKETINAEELDRLVNGEPEPPSLTPSEMPPPSSNTPVATEAPKDEKVRAPQSLQPGLNPA